MRVGIIDLGTNTFNLLIADVSTKGFTIIHQSKNGVALGMGGITDRVIAPDAIERACAAFEQFAAIGATHHVEQWTGIATSAVRDAQNGVAFAQMLTHRFQIPVHIIDGQAEAQLIYRGVSWNNPLADNALIMDIGGGSTEFIQVAQGSIVQLCSLNIGVSRAFQQFACSDPLTTTQQQQLTDWFEAQATDLNAFQKGGRLIGASGSFETFYEMIHQLPFDPSLGSLHVDLKALSQKLDWIISSTFEARSAHPWILPIRRKLAPIAALKTKWLIEKMAISELVISPYSLKEGVLRSMVDA
jgi:exopolyphosphatase/guanosine-5'-triphosphate,3'-diphosphate pyrophosphatase